MKIKSPGIIVGVVASALGAVTTLKPDTFYSTDFSFIEYFISVIGMPLLLGGGAILITLAILFTRFGEIATNEIQTWMGYSPRQFYTHVRSAGFIPIIVCVSALGWFSYEAYAFARNSYSFLRDRFIQQYQVDAFSRCRLDHIQGHLTLAKTCFSNFSKTFEGHQLSEAASRDIKKIDKQLGLKQALIAKARASERLFGPTPLSVHLKIEGLWLHPWDSELRNEIREELRAHFVKAQANLRQNHQVCSSGGVVPPQAVREAFSLLGYMRDAEIGPTAVSGPSLGERLCAIVGPLSPEQLQKQVDSIWQRSKIETLLAATDPIKLDEQRQVALGKLRYPALKTEVQTGHQGRGLIPSELFLAKRDQLALNPVPPEEMIPDPEAKRKTADQRAVRNRNESGPVPVVPELLSLPLPPLPRSAK